MTRLNVESGDVYSVQSGDIQEWSGVTVDGTLEVQGQLKLTDDPDVPLNEVDVQKRPIDLPLSNVNLTDMQTGTALFLAGWMAILGGAASAFRNYAAAITWGLSLFALIASGLFQVGLETFWALSAATVMLLIVGAVVRWSQ